MVGRDSKGEFGQLGTNCATLEEEQLGSSQSAKQEPVRLADLPDVLTPEMVRQLLGLSKRKLAAALRQGTVPSVKVGRRYLIPKKRLERFLGVDEHGGT